MNHRWIILLSGILFLSSCLEKAKTKTQAQIGVLHKQAYGLLKSNPDSALLLADSSLNLAQASNLRWEAANAYYIKGYIYRKQNSMAKALVMYLNSCRILEKQENEKSAKTHIDVLSNSAVIFRKHYKYEEAIALLEKGLEYAERHELAQQRLKLLYNKSFTLYHMDRLDDSLEILNEAVSLAEKQEDQRRIMRCRNLLGLIHKEKKDYQAARDCYDQIIKSTEATVREKSQAHHNMAVSFMKEDRMEEAKSHFERALPLKKKIDDSKLVYNTLHDLAEWGLKTDDPEAAYKYCQEAIALYPALEVLPDNFHIYQLAKKSSHLTQKHDEVDFYSDRYFEEAAIYQGIVENVMKEKDKFQMDLIMAGFEAEQVVNVYSTKAVKFLWISIAFGIVLILLIISWHFWFRWWRKDLWEKVFNAIS